MRPDSLILCGWGPFKGYIKIEFDKITENGLFLITGPTGAGKTTIFDAITFALYGSVSGELREKDSVRSDFADSETPTYAQLVFTHKEKHYTVYRNPKYKRPKRRKTGDERYTTESENARLIFEDGSVLEGNGEVSQQIQRILGLNYKQFKQLSMIAQGEFTRLLVAGNNEKKQIFRDIFHTGIYDKIEEILRKKSTLLYRDYMEVKHKLEADLDGILLNSEEWKILVETEYKDYNQIILYLTQLLEINKQREKELKEKLEFLENLILLKQEFYQSAERREALYKRQNKLKEEIVILKEQYKGIFSEYEKRTALEEKREKLKREIDKHKEVERLETELREKMVLLKQHQEIYTKLDTKAKEKKAAYETADELYKKAAAGLAARFLKEGEQCPVCGALEHPNPAQIADKIPDEDLLKQYKKKYEDSADKAGAVWRQAAELKGETDSIRGMLEEELKKSHTAENSREKGRSVRELEEKLKDTEKIYTKITDDYNGYQSKLAGKEAVLQETERSSSTAEKEFDKKSKIYHNKLTEAGIQEKEDEAEKHKKILSQEKERLAILISNIKQSRKSIMERISQKEAIENEYGKWKELHNVTTGNNSMRLVFEQYVMASYFEDILKAANQRMEKMTNGRYEMSRIDEVRDGRTKDNLEIVVLDYYTGRKRSVKTLSGGELFKAALSLALGMSDVIQNYAGGIGIEALFIDEGFGALDAESLDQAINVLTSLVEKDRCIGIISHVNELKERIGNQIVVEKTNIGSNISVF